MTDRVNRMTEWFPAHIKPVRKGVYEAYIESMPFWKKFTPYAFWDGRQWHNTSDTVEDAIKAGKIGSIQAKVWRGFKKQQR